MCSQGEPGDGGVDEGWHCTRQDVTLLRRHARTICLPSAGESSLEGTWCPLVSGSCSEAEHVFPCAHAWPATLGWAGSAQHPQKLAQAQGAWVACSCLSSPAAQD